MGKALNLTGQKYGQLNVLFRVGNRGKLTQWKCRCNCPRKTSIVVLTRDLRSGKIKDCGCVKRNKLRKIKTQFNMI